MFMSKAQTISSDETLGQRIARLRKARGLTQSQLAEAVEMTQTMISEYELDRRRLHAEMVTKVATALKVSTDELLGMKAAKKANSEFDLKLVRRMQKIAQLPPAKQKMLLHTIDTLLKGTG